MAARIYEVSMPHYLTNAAAALPPQRERLVAAVGPASKPNQSPPGSQIAANFLALHDSSLFRTSFREPFDSAGDTPPRTPAGRGRSIHDDAACSPIMAQRSEERR